MNRTHFSHSPWKNTACLIAALWIGLWGFQAQAEILGNIYGLKEGSGVNKSKFFVSGWTCEVGNAQSLNINILVGDEQVSAVRVRSAKAGLILFNRSVWEKCESAERPRYRFSAEIPQKFVLEHAGKAIFVSVSAAEESQATVYLPNSGRFLLPALAQPSQVKGSIYGISEGQGSEHGQVFVDGWACQTENDEPLNLSVYAGDSSINGSLIAQGQANLAVANPVALRACSATGTKKHRFKIAIPRAAIAQNKGEKLFLYSEIEGEALRTEIPGSGVYTLPTELAQPNVIVIFTDDQGYPDVGVQNVLSDLKTPSIDALAHDGVRFTNGYVTAAQCSPSRAGLVSGLYQHSFGLDDNRHTPMPLTVKTMGNYFQELGYKTGMVGKWHLDVDGNSKEWAAQNVPEIQPYRAGDVPIEIRKTYFPDERGYDDTFFGFASQYWTNYTLDLQDKESSYIRDGRYRIDVASDAAVSFIERNKDEPFYLHVSHYGPHVPMQTTSEYLNQIPSNMPFRRRVALATMLAIDKGVGRMVDTLNSHQLLENTLIFFISDNGAPLGDDMTDAPLSDRREAWNGSRNDPLAGEKGMLTEAGIRVPYILMWKGKLAASVIDKPVSSLDVAVTTLKLAGSDSTEALHGVDLMPVLTGEDSQYLDERPLYWRGLQQRAIRVGKWKYLQAGVSREYLFDLSNDAEEKVNLIGAHPDIAASLRAQYVEWSQSMPRTEDLREINPAFGARYDLYLEP